MSGAPSSEAAANEQPDQGYDDGGATDRGQTDRGQTDCGFDVQLSSRETKAAATVTVQRVAAVRAVHAPNGSHHPGSAPGAVSGGQP